MKRTALGDSVSADPIETIGDEDSILRHKSPEHDTVTK